ncbi:MAG TPA: methyltransferase domain-containing protein [Planctomycetota bacterium]|nr:methyltransferase domain-containing protein [Planctomycetota bacterium]
MMLISATQASSVLGQLRAATQANVSLDLGLTEATVSTAPGGVAFPDGTIVSQEDLRRVAACDDTIFEVAGGAVSKLIRYSEATAKSYKLRPTADWPALEISGILMHRIKGTTPRLDAEAKLRLVAPVLGSVLDTCMGLGYTAILAARTAASVTAVEKDANVIEMARINPHSRQLFHSPGEGGGLGAGSGGRRIRVIQGDAAEVLAGMPDGGFDLVNHDPPTLSVAGELYADAFYAGLLRVLRPGGRLLHYIGSPGSRGRGVNLPASVSRRLGRLGFADVRHDQATGCVLARKRGK